MNIYYILNFIRESPKRKENFFEFLRKKQKQQDIFRLHDVPNLIYIKKPEKGSEVIYKDNSSILE